MIEREAFLKTIRRLTKLRLRTLCKILEWKEGIPTQLREAEALFLWLAQHLDSWCPLTQEHVDLILDHFRESILCCGHNIASAVNRGEKVLPVAHLAIGDRRFCALTLETDFLDLTDGTVVPATESSFSEITLYNLAMIYVRNMARLNKLSQQEAPLCPST